MARDLYAYPSLLANPFLLPTLRKERVALASDDCIREAIGLAHNHVLHADDVRTTTKFHRRAKRLHAILRERGAE